jgi:hypothetical protein
MCVTTEPLRSTRTRGGKGQLKPVFSDRFGEWWRSGVECAACLGCSQSTVSAAARGVTAQPCNGRRLSYTPPAWASEGPLPPPQLPESVTPVGPSPSAPQPVYSDRPGERWVNIRAAATALKTPPSSLAAKMDAGLPVAGRMLYREPPAWAVREDAEREVRRVAAIKVRVPRGGRVHMGNGYGPDGKRYGTIPEEKLKSGTDSTRAPGGNSLQCEAGRPDACDAGTALTEKSA